MKNRFFGNIVILALVLTFTVCNEETPIETQVNPPVTPNTKSSAKSITAFFINGISGDINEDAKTITVIVPTGANVTAITPVVNVSNKADYSPKTAQNFTTQKTYIVTAEDGSTQDYIVTVTIAPILYTYTITFDKNGGDSEANPKTITLISPATTIVYFPTEPTRNGYNFVEWNTQSDGEGTSFDKNTTISTDITVYAKWALWGPPIIVPGTTLIEKFRWLNSNVISNTSYILEVITDELINPHTLFYTGKNNINIQLIGIGSEKKINLYGSGSTFTIGSGITLILDENIDLQGGITVNNGGNLIINQGARIRGVSVSNGTFIMNGGHSGGINISNGIFTMNSGKISGNNSSNGGGVYISNGTFTMNGGEISGNSSSNGGGVYISNGTFTMDGGKIKDNISNLKGGGVYISGGTFIMNDGEISGNTSSNSLTIMGSNAQGSISCGGGIYISYGTLIINGGEISNNSSNSHISFSTSHPPTSYPIYGLTASSYGGGIYLLNSIFTMNDGKIIGNTLSSTGDNNKYGFVTTQTCGGGIYSEYNSRFEKNNGIISSYSSDFAVYCSDNIGVTMIKETFSEYGESLIFITNEPYPPTISGAWD